MLTVGDSGAAGDRSRFIPFPAIERHGTIGDRRTAALVAADGTIDWFCLPDYAGHVVLGALLDVGKGGHWKLGPGRMFSGTQNYVDDTAVLETTWDDPAGKLVLRDAMVSPGSRRFEKETDQRTLIRELRCVRGRVQCIFDLQPGYDFHRRMIRPRRVESAFRFEIGEISFQLWTSSPIKKVSWGFCLAFTLTKGDEMWSVLESGANHGTWSVNRARKALDRTIGYWRKWCKSIHYRGPRSKEVRRSAITVHLLTYAPEGSIVAAPVTSLPERIGGGWTADYRLCWVRDASRSLAVLELLGDWEEAEKYLAWLTERDSTTKLPLQVLYGIHGETRTPQKELRTLTGYRGSHPVPDWQSRLQTTPARFARFSGRLHLDFPAGKRALAGELLAIDPTNCRLHGEPLARD